jgi:glycosyltransferase involved in cell wall biosynthesis
MEKPILSIIVPAYNAGAYLDKCLISLLITGEKDYLDVIIINDGSTDNTFDVAMRYSERYPHIYKVVNQENGGHGSGIMTGIAYATGKYLRIIDADDWANTQALTELINDLYLCDSDLVITPFTLVDMRTGKTRIRQIPDGVSLHNEMLVDHTPELFHYYDIHCLTVKTELIRNLKIELPRKTFYEDSEYVLKAVSGAKTVTCFPENVYQYLVGNTSQSMDARKMVERYEQHDLVLHRMIEASALAQKNKRVLCSERIRILALKQLIIAFIYDEDRKRGRARAVETTKLLKEACPEVGISLKRQQSILKVFCFIGIKAGLWERLKLWYQKTLGK